MATFDDIFKNANSKQALKSLLEYHNIVFESDFVASFSPNYQCASAVVQRPNVNDKSSVKTIAAKVVSKPKIESKREDVKSLIESTDNVDDVVKQPVKSYHVDLSDVKTIDDLKLRVENFNGCHLKTANTNTVFCDGALDSEILIMGEAPGEEENENKIPFCGRSGKLLMEALKSIGLYRDKNFFITNTVFYRPPLNRNPTDDEIQSCKPFVEKLIEISNVKYIICVGGISLKSYIGFDSISSSRQKVSQLKFGSKTVIASALYHPSYFLRSPLKKKDAFFDLLWIKENLLQGNV